MLKLQRLVIPSGWEVTKNRFFEIDPIKEPRESDRWQYFGREMLEVQYVTKSRLTKRQIKAGEQPVITSVLSVCIGWYPEGDPKGAFGINVVKTDERWEEIESFWSRNKDEVVEKIEEFLLKYK